MLLCVFLPCCSTTQTAGFFNSTTLPLSSSEAQCLKTARNKLQAPMRASMGILSRSCRWLFEGDAALGSRGLHLVCKSLARCWTPLFPSTICFPNPVLALLTYKYKTVRNVEYLPTTPLMPPLQHHLAG